MGASTGLSGQPFQKVNSYIRLLVKVGPEIAEARSINGAIASDMITEYFSNRTAVILMIGVCIFAIDVEDQLPDRNLGLQGGDGHGRHGRFDGV